jgi:hypothetical protein
MKSIATKGRTLREIQSNGCLNPLQGRQVDDRRKAIAAMR